MIAGIALGLVIGYAIARLTQDATMADIERWQYEDEIYARDRVIEQLDARIERGL